MVSAVVLPVLAILGLAVQLFHGEDACWKRVLMVHADVFLAARKEEAVERKLRERVVAPP